MGAKPTRSRRCNRSILLHNHWATGKGSQVTLLEPEDLPIKAALILREIEDVVIPLG